MPLTFEIDHPLRIVFAQASGVLTPQDLFSYQEQVWALPEFRGYDECVDMSGVTMIVDATEKNMQALAALAVRSDDPMQPTRLAIIAREDLHFGLARMYGSYRSMHPSHSRQVGIFRTRDEALRWLSDGQPAS